MKKLLSSSVVAQRAVFSAIFLAVVVVGSWMIPNGWSQAPLVTTSNAALTPFLVKIKAQQDAMAANQTKIEAQTTQLKEEVRQLKIYAGRAGSKR